MQKIWMFLFLLLALPTINRSVSQVEIIFADMNDAYGAMSVAQSGFYKTYRGKDGKQWEAIYHDKRRELAAALKKIQEKNFAPEDRRAVMLMRRSLSDEEDVPSPASGKCRDAEQKNIPDQKLREALYACFDEIGGNLRFEGKSISRLTVFHLLTQIQEADRRKEAFLAIQPLWKAINRDDRRDSPYR